MLDRAHVDAGCQCSLVTILLRHDDAAAGATGRDCRRQCAAHRSYLTEQAELTDHLESLEALCGQRAGARKYSERDAEIETTTLFRQIGRREIDGDLALGKLEAAGLNGAFHAFARFAHRGLGQPDHRKPGQAAGNCVSMMTSGASMPRSARDTTATRSAFDIWRDQCGAWLQRGDSRFESSNVAIQVLELSALTFEVFAWNQFELLHCRFDDRRERSLPVARRQAALLPSASDNLAVSVSIASGSGRSVGHDAFR